MPIPISYYGSYKIRSIQNPYSGFDIKSMRNEMKKHIPKNVQESCGIYIFFHKRSGAKAGGKLAVFYVGSNTTGNLLNEAYSEKNKERLSNRFLRMSGTPQLLLLTCRKPSGMFAGTFKRNIKGFEKYLVEILSLSGHRLDNTHYIPKKKKMNLNISGKKSCMTFRKFFPDVNQLHY